MTRSVLVVYPHLPHYRYGVFRALDQDPELEVTFAAAEASRDRSIATLPSNDFAITTLRNIWFGPFLWQRGLVWHLLHKRYDVVVMLGDVKYLSTWVAAGLLRLRRRPVLLWTIGWHRPDHGVVKHARMAFYRLAHGLALYGHVARGLGESMGYPTARMHVVGNSCSSLVSHDAVPNPDLDVALSEMRPLRLLMVGRLTAVKSLDLVVRAVASSPQLRDQTTILLAGDGPEKAALAALADELCVDVRLPGAVYSEHDLDRLYSVADVTVVPGAAGLTVVQSLEHGVPVVTHDAAFHQMPEAEAVIPGRTGALFRRNDSADLARTLERWHMASGDRSATADVCRDEAHSNWSPEVHARRIKRALAQTLAQFRE